MEARDVPSASAVAVESRSTTTAEAEGHKLKVGGFPEELFDELSDKEKESVFCNICLNVVNQCCQCSNSHLFCRSCIFVWTHVSSSNSEKCPVCRTSQSSYPPVPAVDSMLIDKKVSCLVENCSFKSTLQMFLLHTHGKATYHNEQKDYDDYRVTSRSGNAQRLLEDNERLIDLINFMERFDILQALMIFEMLFGRSRPVNVTSRFTSAPSSGDGSDVTWSESPRTSRVFPFPLLSLMTASIHLNETASRSSEQLITSFSSSSQTTQAGSHVSTASVPSAPMDLPSLSGDSSFSSIDDSMNMLSGDVSRNTESDMSLSSLSSFLSSSGSPEMGSEMALNYSSSIERSAFLNTINHLDDDDDDDDNDFGSPEMGSEMALNYSSSIERSAFLNTINHLDDVDDNDFEDDYNNAATGYHSSWTPHRFQPPERESFVSVSSQERIVTPTENASHLVFPPDISNSFPSTETLVGNSTASGMEVLMDDAALFGNFAREPQTGIKSNFQLRDDDLSESSNHGSLMDRMCIDMASLSSPEREEGSSSGFTSSTYPSTSLNDKDISNEITFDQLPGTSSSFRLKCPSNILKSSKVPKSTPGTKIQSNSFTVSLDRKINKSPISLGTGTNKKTTFTPKTSLWPSGRLAALGRQSFISLEKNLENSKTTKDASSSSGKSLFRRDKITKQTDFSEASASATDPSKTFRFQPTSDVSRTPLWKKPSSKVEFFKLPSISSSHSSRSFKAPESSTLPKLSTESKSSSKDRKSATKAGSLIGSSKKVSRC